MSFLSCQISRDEAINKVRLETEENIKGGQYFIFLLILISNFWLSSSYVVINVYV